MTTLFHLSYQSLDTTRWYNGNNYVRIDAQPGTVDIENASPLVALTNDCPTVEVENFRAPIEPTNIIPQR